MKQNRSQSVVQLAAQYNAGSSRNVLEHTVPQTLLDIGQLRNPPPMYLCWQSVIINYAYAGCRNIATGQWISGRVVTWSNESWFVIHHVDIRIRVRRLPVEGLLTECTAGHTQVDGGGIMFWGTFSWASLGPVIVVEQMLNATEYLNIWTLLHITYTRT